MTDRRERRREAGFTLVEALFATLLIAVILGMIATVTAQWLPNWNRGMARVERVELVAAGLERLVGDIAAAEFVSAGDANAPPLFDGAELSLTLVRTALGPNAGPGLEVVRIAELADDRGPSLVRMTAPFVPTAEDNRTGEQFAFANRVAVVRSPYRVSFAYAGLDGVWRATWRREAQLPHMVRISVRRCGHRAHACRIDHRPRARRIAGALRHGDNAGGVPGPWRRADHRRVEHRPLGRHDSLNSDGPLACSRGSLATNGLLALSSWRCCGF